MLIIGRAVAGLGASGLLNGSYTIIAISLPLAKQPCSETNSLGYKNRKLTVERV